MLTTKQAGDVIKVNASRIRQLCLAGRIKATRLARDWDIDEQSLRQYDKTGRQKKGRKPGSKLAKSA